VTRIATVYDQLLHTDILEESLNIARVVFGALLPCDKHIFGPRCHPQEAREMTKEIV
jgi:hypothetical protein